MEGKQNQAMEGDRFERIALGALTPSPYNERESYEGDDFERLKESILEKGVLQPILVRPLNGSGQYEIVAGERRWRASMAAGLADIPAYVRPLDDDGAMECTIIENLHREDISEIAEARAFKKYIDRKGPAGIPDLEKRVSKSATYIRRRIKALELPAEIIELWAKGELIYSHLEELTRLGDPQRAIEVAKQFIKSYDKDRRTVSFLRNQITQSAPPLKDAQFNKQECKVCEKNTEYYFKLYGGEKIKGASCIDPGCFMHRQNDFLLANWATTAAGKKHHTNGFRFQDKLNYNEYERIAGKVNKKCEECADLVSLVDRSGVPTHTPLACVKPACFKTTYKSAARVERYVPPVAPEFRRTFFKDGLTAACVNVPADDERYLRFAAFVLIDRGYEVRKAILEANAVLTERMKKYEDEGTIEALWLALQDMTGQELKDMFIEAVRAGLIFDTRAELTRMTIAKHFGVELKDWQISAAYLNKKEVKDLVKLVDELKLLEDEKAKAYYDSKLGGKELASLEKKQLVALFLKSGADLAGKVPKEILEVN